jgi:hypothetical protein
MPATIHPRCHRLYLRDQAVVVVVVVVVARGLGEEPGRQDPRANREVKFVALSVSER